MNTVVLINVGTPQGSDPISVGNYLREFLMDENILQIPRPFRDILVKWIIVPRRKFSSAKKYQSVWTEQGSPLLVECEKLKLKLQMELGPNWQVLLGMQVGQPSLRNAIKTAKSNGGQTIFIPLYPQFAMATTGGALKLVEKYFVDMDFKSIPPFYDKTWFIKSQAAIIRPFLKPDFHLLLSYHGLPISHLKKHNSFCYQSQNCCAQLQSCEKNCYKAQCLKTSSLLKSELGLQEMSVAFQSRLGRGKWIEPSTQETIVRLAKTGVKNLIVACPSFTVDCLETLEEIGMELRQEFLHTGGQNFELVPCLNNNGDFVNGLATQIEKKSY
jgi:protoporphyrin/coproporphyrin ferrochelatase